MPKTTNRKSARPTKDSDDGESALRSASVAIAALAATDEEFAAGIPLKNPRSIVMGRAARSKTTAGVKSAKSSGLNASRKYGVNLPSVDPDKIKAAFKKRAQLKKGSELLSAKLPKKRAQ